MCTILQGYLQEVSEILRERAVEAKTQVAQRQGIAENTSILEFQRGILLGYYEVLSTLVSQARAFDIPLEMIGLADFEPDKLLN